MRARCNNPNAVNFSFYGGRGIKVCVSWVIFDTFYEWAIDAGFNDSLQLDRIDNEKGYSPDNCRWSTAKENANNRSNNIFIKAWNERKTISEWADDPRCVVSDAVLRLRLRRNWPLKEAMKTPVKTKASAPVLVTLFNETKTLAAWARDVRCKVTYKTLHKRIRILGWLPERAILK